MFGISVKYNNSSIYEPSSEIEFQFQFESQQRTGCHTEQGHMSRTVFVFHLVSVLEKMT